MTSELPSLEELDLTAGEEHRYDFVKAERILRAMDFLRREAKSTGIEEIVTMIDATFRLLLTTYYCIMRHELTRLSGDDAEAPAEDPSNG